MPILLAGRNANSSADSTVHFCRSLGHARDAIVFTHALRTLAAQIRQTRLIFPKPENSLRQALHIVRFDQDSSSGIHLTSAFNGIGTCATTAYVSWHNIDTGARGNTTVKLVGSWYNSATIPSGPGHIELSVTTKEFIHSPDSVQVQYVIPG